LRDEAVDAPLDRPRVAPVRRADAGARLRQRPGREPHQRLRPRQVRLDLPGDRPGERRVAVRGERPRASRQRVAGLPPRAEEARTARDRVAPRAALQLEDELLDVEGDDDRRRCALLLRRLVPDRPERTVGDHDLREEEGRQEQAADQDPSGQAEPHAGSFTLVAVVIASALRKELSGSVLFDGVSFKVERGDRLALAGPNGAGKTTLLRALVGEVSLEGGE